MRNSLMLDGFIASEIREERSPFGIIAFWSHIRHYSEQWEHFQPRQTALQLPLVMVGDGFNERAKSLKRGVKVKVQGFLNNHKKFNGESHLVLHALQIELID